jgi:tripartite-type tricarboxylate transporter receptor subunit TctC
MKAGKLRALACFGSKRAAGAPDVPTFKELGYDIEFSLWVGVFAPKNTPAGPVKILRENIGKVANSAQFKTLIANIGDEVAYLDGPDFARFWDEDAKRVEAAVLAIGKQG